MLSPRASQIRRMFTAVAPRYDFLNHLLSFNMDRLWRRRAVRLLRQTISARDALCLDVCCGTGDLSLELSRQGTASIVSCDFSHAMMVLNRKKIIRQHVEHRIRIVEADALCLPFASRSFDAVTIGFGLRNLESAREGLEEIWRVLKPDGKLVVLEFSKPVTPIFKTLFRFYFSCLLPRVGNAISRHDHAYTYLPDSVSEFPDQLQLLGIMRECGFGRVGFVNLSGGVAAIHYGEKLDDGETTNRMADRFVQS
jgi:demethylmenaquinone methyltransferase / 2-methoxy-6-polyprenyl-1,4-benzoquinol methylase